MWSDDQRCPAASLDQGQNGLPLHNQTLYAGPSPPHPSLLGLLFGFLRNPQGNYSAWRSTAGMNGFPSKAFSMAARTPWPCLRTVDR